MKKDKLMFKGVIPSKNIVGCVVHKSAKKGTKSFRITSALLNTIVKKAQRVGKTPLLVLSIPANEKENYVLTCHVTKEKK